MLLLMEPWMSRRQKLKAHKEALAGREDGPEETGGRLGRQDKGRAEAHRKATIGVVVHLMAVLAVAILEFGAMFTRRGQFTEILI
jgi:hypothetical protein